MKERFLSIFKFLLSMLLLPAVIGVTASFWENLNYVHSAVSAAFGWGIVGYLILHILLYEPARVYEAGTKLSEKASGFLFPLFKMAGYCVPIFTLLSFLLYYLTCLKWPDKDFFPFFAFLAAFTFMMHLVFTVNTLKKKQPGALRENYFFSIFLIYIVNMIVIAGAFAILAKDFSFPYFWERFATVSGAIYTASFRQLFVVEGR